MENKKYKEIIENYIRAYNNFDIETMMADMHDLIIFKNISNGEVNLTTNGIDEFKDQAELAKEYLKERKMIITEMIFNKDQVDIEIAYTGILSVDIPDGPNKGDKIELIGKSVFTFKDNKIIELSDIS